MHPNSAELVTLAFTEQSISYRALPTWLRAKIPLDLLWKFTWWLGNCLQRPFCTGPQTVAVHNTIDREHYPCVGNTFPQSQAFWQLFPFQSIVFAWTKHLAWSSRLILLDRQNDIPLTMVFWSLPPTWEVMAAVIRKSSRDSCAHVFLEVFFLCVLS